MWLATAGLPRITITRHSAFEAEHAGVVCQLPRAIFQTLGGVRVTLWANFCARAVTRHAAVWHGTAWGWMRAPALQGLVGIGIGIASAVAANSDDKHHTP